MRKNILDNNKISKYFRNWACRLNDHRSPINNLNFLKRDKTQTTGLAAQTNDTSSVSKLLSRGAGDMELGNNYYIVNVYNLYMDTDMKQPSKKHNKFIVIHLKIEY